MVWLSGRFALILGRAISRQKVQDTISLANIEGRHEKSRADSKITGPGSGPDAAATLLDPHRAELHKAIYKPGESVLLWGCSGVASRLSPWVSLVHPLYIPYLSLVHPISLLGHSCGATAPLPGRRVRLARDRHGELRWKRRSPAIRLLPGTDKDARTRREVTEFL